MKKNNENVFPIIKTVDLKDEIFIINEYKITQQLDLPEIRKIIKKFSYQGKPALEYETVEGISLKAYLKAHPASIKEALTLMLKCCCILKKIHDKGIIHNRINLSNFIYNDVEDSLKITDFQWARKGEFRSGNINFLLTEEDKFIYSPELIGIASGKVDFRSDIYALGVLFYEFFTNNHPFKNNNSEHSIFTNLFIDAIPLHQLNPNVPKVISDLGLLMVKKQKEDRYESLESLIFDLKHCIENLDFPTKLNILIPGKFTDKSSVLFSEKLYGKNKYREIIKGNLLKSIKGETIISFLTGNSGNGKSSLISSLVPDILQTNSIFISGKYEVTNTEQLYSGIIQALEDLAAYILSEPDAIFENWKERLQELIGGMNNTLCDIIPIFKDIIGEKSETNHELNGIEVKNRISYLFLNILNNLANEFHPVVIFLDDIHLADKATLNLIKQFGQQKNASHFYLICAYPKNYVNPSNHFKAFINEKNKELEEIEIKNWSLGEINQFLLDSFNIENGDEFSETLLRKTLGVPSYVKFFLKESLEHSHLVFNHDQKKWEFIIEKIKQQKSTSNVVDAIRSRYNGLSVNLKLILQKASCFGTIIPHDLLELIDSSELLALNTLFEEGFLEQQLNNDYRFIHEDLQKAIYSSIAEDQKNTFHFQIGLALLDRYEFNLQENKAKFEVCNHLLKGGDLFHSHEKRFQFIELAMEAGLRAKKIGDFDLSYHYLSSAASHIRKNEWSTYPEKALSLFVLACEAANICGEYDNSDKWGQEVIKRTKDMKDQLLIYETRIYSLIEKHELSEAFNELLIVLNKIGFSISKKPSQPLLIKELVVTQYLLLGKSTNDLLNLPELTNWKAQAFMRLMTKSVVCIFSIAPDALPLMILKFIQLSLKYGNSIYSPLGYAFYGFMQAAFLGNIKKGYNFGKLSLDLVEKMNAVEVKSKAMVTFYGFLAYWKDEFRQSVSELENAYRIGRETGDLLYASFSTTFKSSLKFFQGDQLGAVLESMTLDSEIIKKLNQDLVFLLSESQRQLVLNLSGKSKNPLELTGEAIIEKEYITLLNKKKDQATLFDFYVYKLILAYILEGNEELLDLSEKAEVNEDDISSRQIIYPSFLLFTVLAFCRHLRQNPNKKEKLKTKIRKRIKKLKLFADDAPKNFSGFYYLAKAEYYRTFHKESPVFFYTKGIEESHNRGIIYLEAILREQLAEYYKEMEEWEQCEMFLRKALICYQKWQSPVKCEQLKRKYPLFLDTVIPSVSSLTNIELQTIQEFHQTISKENSTEGALKMILMLILKYMEAQHGAFLSLEENKEINIRTSGSSESIQYYKTVPKNKEEIIPLSVMNLVNRSKKPIRLNKLKLNSHNLSDPYFEKNKPFEIYCMPILFKGTISGFVYIESRKIHGYFPDNKIDFLEVFSSQLAVTLENARLFDQEKKMQLTEKLYQKNILEASVQVQENERKRIAGDLHDEVGAILSTAKIYVDHLQTQLGDPEESGLINKIGSLLNETTQKIREISHNLSPVLLEQCGLQDSIQSMCNDLNRTGTIKASFTANFEQEIPEKWTIQLYRIFRELLNNTLKHAKANNINVQFYSIEESIKFIYQDDGRGFKSEVSNTQQLLSEGLGLNSIIARTEIMNGSIKVESKPNEGAKFTFEIPNVK